jgi:hypothetical protein
MKSKANIFEIPWGILGFIVVPTLLSHPGILSNIVNPFTSISFLFVRWIEIPFAKQKKYNENYRRK